MDEPDKNIKKNKIKDIINAELLKISYNPIKNNIYETYIEIFKD